MISSSCTCATMEQHRSVWLCDGICDNCEFHAAGDILSLDATTANENDEEVSLLDGKQIPLLLYEDVICDKIELEQLFKRLDELMPDARKIGELRMEGYSDEAISKIIGTKRTTFRSQIDKAKKMLAKQYPDRF